MMNRCCSNSSTPAKAGLLFSSSLRKARNVSQSYLYHTLAQPLILRRGGVASLLASSSSSSSVVTPHSVPSDSLLLTYVPSEFSTLAGDTRNRLNGGHSSSNSSSSSSSSSRQAKWTTATTTTAACLLGCGGIVATSALWENNKHNNSKRKNHNSSPFGSLASTEASTFESIVPDLDDLPEYTSDFVAKNNGENGKPVWMSYGGAVYDLTNFVKNHPGGSERILMAAGKAVEPFWYLYRQHFASDLPLALLEKYTVGRLCEQDQDRIDQELEDATEREEDPYAHEPQRDPLLRVHSEQPMNAEVPAFHLTQNYLTPADHFYIRHHHPVPLLTEQQVDEYELEIDVSGFVNKDNKDNKRNHTNKGILKISLHDLKQLPKVEVTATLQCSGNRRGDMNKVMRTSGTSWGQGAISTAKWGGVKLVHLLRLAGLDDPYTLGNNHDHDQNHNHKNGEQTGTEETHVRFESLDGMRASIHATKATDPYGDVIVAYEMNDAPLPRDHGFPLRVIVPGYAAVRNVKWLSKIQVSPEEAEGDWQRGLNYKTLPPNVTDAASIVDMQEMPSMTEVSVFSGITSTERTTTTTNNKENNNNNNQQQQQHQEQQQVVMNIKGWAWAGGGRNVVRVDVTGNGGQTWSTANITHGRNQRFGRAWAWVFWECRGVPCTVTDDGRIELASKAVDLAFNVQPEDARHGWNVRGLGNNSWYKKIMTTTTTSSSSTE